jgi:A/G-specific adenine glycosylase
MSSLEKPKSTKMKFQAIHICYNFYQASVNTQCQACPIINQCAWLKNGFPKTELVRKSQDWQGTDRKCRGTIVQALRENDSLTESAIKKLWPDQSQVEKALLTLLNDSLIEKQSS